MADLTNTQTKLSALKLVPKSDMTASADKLKNFSKLERVEKEFVHKMTGKAYKKHVQVLKEGPKHPDRAGKLKEAPERRGAAAPQQQGAPANQRPREVWRNGQWVKQEFKNGKWQDMAPGGQQRGFAQLENPNKQPKEGQLKPNPNRPEKQPAERPNVAEKKPVQRVKKRRAGEGWYHGEDIRRRIGNDGDYAMEQMLLMQEYQTEYEHKIKGTKFKNMVGFNKPDAEFFAEVMDQIKNHGGLGRLRQAMGSAGWSQIERQIQGRMGKYSNQLADIYNDNNRYRNFKTIEDMFKEAKGINTEQLSRIKSAMRGIEPNSGLVERAMIGTGKLVSQQDMRRIIDERKRGPKWKADAVVKRFDNAKVAAEYWHVMNEIGRNNPNPNVQALHNNYVQAKDDQFNRLGRNVDDVMAKGFENMNMKEKTQLKQMMKELAPEIADMFNYYKEQGQSVPKGKQFVGKGLKQIKEENVIARNGEPNIPVPAPEAKVEPVKPRPQAEKPAAEEPVGAKGLTKANLRNIEKVFSDGIPKQVNPERDFHNPERKGINETNLYGKGTDQEMFYKPEDGRGSPVHEVMAFETAKLLGIESLVAPVKMWTPKIEDRNGNVRDGKKGSTMMSTRVLAKKTGLGQVKHAAGMFNSDGKAHVIENTDNFSDMMVFDYLIGNTDRHNNNWHIAKTQNGKYHALAIDHGFSFAHEYGGDHIYMGRDLKAKVDKKAISGSMQRSIKNFDKNGFRSAARKTGMKEREVERFLSRIDKVQTHMRESGGEKFTVGDMRKIMNQRDRWL